VSPPPQSYQALALANSSIFLTFISLALRAITPRNQPDVYSQPSSGLDREAEQRRTAVIFRLEK